VVVHTDTDRQKNLNETTKDQRSPAGACSALGACGKSGDGDLLRKQDGRSEVVAESQDLWDLVIPVQILSVDVKKILACERPAGRVKDIK
jgi:hypothetical protein